MEYSVQSLHKLPVLNCDKMDNAKSKELKTNDGNNIRFKDVPRSDPETKPHRKKAIKTKKKGSNVQAKDIKCKRRKSTSHTDIKETLSYCTYYMKRLWFRDPTNNSREYKKSRKLNRENKGKKLNKRSRNINQDLINDIYDFNLNNYYDGLNDCANKVMPILKNLKKHAVSRKQRKSIGENYALNKVKSSDLSYLGSASNNNFKRPASYKVIHFPNYDLTEPELEDIDFARKKERMIRDSQCQTENKSGFQKNQQSVGKLSRISVDQKGGGDSSSSPIRKQTEKEDSTQNENPKIKSQSNISAQKVNCIEKENPKATSQSNNSVQKEDCRNKDNLKVHSRQNISPSKELCTKSKVKSQSNVYYCKSSKALLDPVITYGNILNLTKVALKYLVFGLVLIIWSPCIVTLYLSWCIIHPLRPKYPRVRRDSKCKRNFKSDLNVCGSNDKTMTDSENQTCKNDIWSTFIRGITTGHDSIALLFGVFNSLLNSSKNQTNKNRTSGVLTNPKKKYTVYYNRNKGWIMESEKSPISETNSGQCLIKGHENLSLGTNRITRNHRDLFHCSCEVHKDKHGNNKKPFSQHPTHSHRCSRPGCGQTNSKSNSHHCPCKSRPNGPLYKQDRLRSRNEQHSQRTHKHHHKKCSKCFKSNKQKKKSLKHQLFSKFKQYCNKTRCVIRNAESEVFKDDYKLDTCSELYIKALRRRPGFRIYKLCPSLYPAFLWTYRFYRNMCRLMLLFISACIWCPLLAFIYLCYVIFCRCFDN